MKNKPVFRKTLFIKPRLQLRYILIPVLLTAISMSVVYLTLSRIIFTSELMSGLSQPQIEAFKNSFRFSFLWVFLFMVAASGLESLFRFHKFVGPVHVVEKVVKTFASGNLTEEFHTRKKDELKELIAELTAMREGLRNFVSCDQKACQGINLKLERLLSSIDYGLPLPTLRREIEAAREELTLVSSHFKL